jgi:hypothetical protein
VSGLVLLHHLRDRRIDLGRERIDRRLFKARWKPCCAKGFVLVTQRHA